jgi:hypothetical protein
MITRVGDAAAAAIVAPNDARAAEPDAEAAAATDDADAGACVAIHAANFCDWFAESVATAVALAGEAVVAGDGCVGRGGVRTVRAILLGLFEPKP